MCPKAVTLRCLFASCSVSQTADIKNDLVSWWRETGQKLVLGTLAEDGESSDEEANDESKDSFSEESKAVVDSLETTEKGIMIQEELNMLCEDSSFVGCDEKSEMKDDNVDPESEEEVAQKDKTIP